MVCQLRPLLYSLGLNNPPRICLTPRKSRVKNLWCNKQGSCRCKMAGAGIRSFAKLRDQMPRIAKTGISSALAAQVAAVKSSLYQSALKFILLSVAIRATVILFMAISILNSADCHNPRHTFEHRTWQETEFQLPPCYIEGPPVRSVIYFCRAAFRV
jgi:hypothetical protein